MIVETILRALDDQSVMEALQPASIKETLASLPPAVRAALEAGDAAQLRAALADLPEAEAAAIIEALETAGIIGRRPDAPPHLQAPDPDPVGIEFPIHESDET